MHCAAVYTYSVYPLASNYTRSELESVSRSGKEMDAAIIISLIGGVIMVAGGLAGLYMYGIWSQGGMPGWGPMMGGWGMQQGWFAGMVGTVSGISLAAGGVVVFGAYSMYAKPESRNTWGIGILVASIVGLFGMGGGLIGPILGIIGGVLALKKK